MTSSSEPCPKIVAIASCPSSGSTLLADIIDSLPNYVCGPESSLLAVASQCNINHSNDLLKPLLSLDPCKNRLSINFSRLHEYGLNKSLLVNAWNKTKSVDDFLCFVSKRYIAFRGKPQYSYFCEKTPTNFAYAREIVEIPSVIGVLFVVRNPYYTISSMLLRGYSADQALLAWTQSAATALDMKYKGLPVSIISYENLVADPGETVLVALKELKLEYADQSPSQVMNAYKNNAYRQIVSPKSITTWKVRSYGDVQNANKAISPRVLHLIDEYKSALVNIDTSDLSCELRSMSLGRLMSYYNYEVEPLGANKIDSKYSFLFLLKQSIKKIAYFKPFILIYMLRPFSSFRRARLRAKRQVQLRLKSDSSNNDY